MAGTVSEIFGWVRHKLLLYILISAVLIFGGWAQSEIGKIAEKENLLSTVEAKIHALDDELKRLTSGADPIRMAYERARKLQEIKEQERSAYKADHWFAWIPFSAQWTELKRLDIEVSECIVKTEAARMLLNGRIKALTVAREVQIALKAEYDEYLKCAKKWKELLPKFWLAFGILVSAIATSIAIKLFLYFVVAPIASRKPPIQILPDVSGQIRLGAPCDVSGDAGKISAVSRPISLKENQELLVRPEYLQSTSQRARKRTQWLLNSSIPYGSILSGMFLLTRVQSPEADKVVISATKDPLSEVCVLELPDESAFVCQPRALVGVIQDQTRPIRITRHWRLGNLQSWLTMQLRFLVFHGPGQLILKGCRGVRMERAGQGRMINQAATIGFSANISYANTRCEAFMSYWMGKEDLFNDIFTGESGSYVYEEMPDLKHKSGIAGRGLEGIFDSVLKVVGV